MKFSVTTHYGAHKMVITPTQLSAMKTMLRPQLCASRCCLILALATTAGTAFSADPAPQSRPGFFTRIGNVFQRIGRETESSTRPVSQTKTEEKRYYANGKSYQILTSKVTVNTVTHWDGAVVTPPPNTRAVTMQPTSVGGTMVVPQPSSGPGIIMRTSYSPGANFSRTSPAPEMPMIPAPSPALDAFSPVPNPSSSPMVPASIETTKQQVAASTQTLTDETNLQPSPQPAVKTEAPKVFPSAIFLSYGRAKSPYAPYNTLDVEGLPSGSFARDPSTGKIFRVP